MVWYIGGMWDLLFKERRNAFYEAQSWRPCLKISVAEVKFHTMV